MKIVAFIEPPQGDVIEKILRHCGLWNPQPARGPPADPSVHAPDEPRELSYGFETGTQLVSLSVGLSKMWWRNEDRRVHRV